MNVTRCMKNPLNVTVLIKNYLQEVANMSLLEFERFHNLTERLNNCITLKPSNQPEKQCRTVRVILDREQVIIFLEKITSLQDFDIAFSYKRGKTQVLSEFSHVFQPVNELRDNFLDELEFSLPDRETSDIGEELYKIICNTFTEKAIARKSNVVI